MAKKRPAHHHGGHRERMREKLSQNRDHTLLDHELVEMLLYYVYPQSDTNEKAHQVLEYFDNKVYNLLNADKQQLINAGFTDRGASFIELFHELVRVYNLGSVDSKFTFTDIDSLKEYCIGLINNAREEHFYVICFDVKNQKINNVLASRGGQKSVDISMRTVVDISVTNKAASVVLVHNHPNGLLNASVEDIASTQAIARALRILGINLADHIIVSGNRAISLREQGCFEVKLDDRSF